MMNCDKAKLLLSDYMDKTLDPEVKKEIDDFLKTDEECNKIFAEALSMQNQLKSLPKVKPSDEFELNLRNRIIDFNNGNEKQPVLNKKGLSLVFSGVVLVSALYMFIFTDVGTQQNISDEILPSSTITNTTSSAGVIDDATAVDKQDEANPVAETDSLKNQPEKIDNSGIHLAGERK
jgi:hypothetical protein